MDELKRNGSGYVDPTAYEAMKKVQSEEPKIQKDNVDLMAEGIAKAVYSICKRIKDSGNAGENLTRTETIKRLAEAFEKVAN